MNPYGFFTISWERFCGVLTQFATCKCCGESYWVNPDTQRIQCNRRVITRCLGNHPQQESPQTQIDRSIAYHAMRA